VVATDLLFAVLLGGPEELEGLSAHRLVVIGGGVDLLFRGIVDSVRRGVFFLVLLRLLLEQEPEIFSFSFVVKKSRCRGRLNSEKVEDGSAVSRSTRSQLQRR